MAFRLEQFVGAAGDNLAYNDAALETAMAALPAGGGKIIFGSGRWRFQQNHAVTKPIVFEGEGQGTVIVPASANAGWLTFLAQDCEAAKMVVAPEIVQTGGVYFNAGTGSAGLRLRKLKLHGAMEAARLGALTGKVLLDDVNVIDPVPVNGIGFRVNATAIIEARNTHVLCSGKPFAGWVWERCQDATLISCQNVNAGKAWYVCPGADQVVAAVKSVACRWDGCDYALWVVPNGGSAVRWTFDTPEFTSNTNEAGYFDMGPNSQINNFYFNCPTINFNGKTSDTKVTSQDGMFFANPGIKDVHFNGGYGADNGKSAIRFAAGMKQFSVLGFRGGAAGDLPGNRRYAVEVDPGASDDYAISLGMSKGNILGGLLDGGTGVNKIIGPNIG